MIRVLVPAHLLAKTLVAITDSALEDRVELVVPEVGSTAIGSDPGGRVGSSGNDQENAAVGLGVGPAPQREQAKLVCVPCLDMGMKSRAP